ncbi:hypothetical protein LINPERHAP1_LOCUS26073 [Linum perenne]
MPVRDLGRCAAR